LVRKSCLRFEDDEVEKQYLNEVAIQNGRRVKAGTNAGLIVLSIYLVIEMTVRFPYVGEWSFASMGILMLIRISIYGTLLLLRLVPERYLEYTILLVETYLLCLVSLANVYRLKRYSLIDELPNTEFNDVWTNCDDDLTMHARDALLVCVTMGIEVFFGGILHIRTRIAWIPKACVTICFSSLYFVPTLRLNDGGGTGLLLIALVALFGFMLGVGALSEQDKREKWSLHRLREAEAESFRELLELAFPVVVSVERDGSIVEASDDLQQHFGVEVPTVDDLLCRRDDLSDYEPAVAALISDVERTRKPAKRNFMIRPRGATMVVEASVCATSDINRSATILCFDIRESFPAGLFDDIQSDIGSDGPSVKFDQRYHSNVFVAEADSAMSSNLDSISSSPAESLRPRDRKFDRAISGLSARIPQPVVAFESRSAPAGVGRKATDALQSLLWSLLIAPSRLRRADHRGADSVPRHFEMGTTPVEIHNHWEGTSRSLAEQQFREEVRMLLNCRHPNVHLMIGFSRFAEGPVLIMERVWGSVAAALESGPLGNAAALIVGAQIASAVQHLHNRHVHHRAIGIESVFLLTQPAQGPVIAKLGNFAEARADYQRSVALEVRSLLALIYNLFTTQPSQRVEIPDMDKLASEGRVSGLRFTVDAFQRLARQFQAEADAPFAPSPFLAGLEEELPEVVLLMRKGWQHGHMEVKEIAETLVSLSKPESRPPSAARPTLQAGWSMTL
jgi:hypothetical protein